MSESNEIYKKNALKNEGTVTLLDVLKEEEEIEEKYAAVLGASDEKRCTYIKGAIPRQALYSCLTCCPESRNDLSKCAGICLACTYSCHENHELIELYTKRNFRCDCPTVRVDGKCCALNPQFTEKQPINKNNVYNQNFQGLYCNCKRPYPDLERNSDEEMLQCSICEDWYHLSHINAPDGAANLIDASSDIICNRCMDKHKFLSDYAADGWILQASEDLDEMDTTIEDECDDYAEIAQNFGNELRLQLDGINEIVNTNETGNDENPKTCNVVKLEDANNEELPVKRAKLANEACVRPKMNNGDNEIVTGATFWKSDWRKALCKCSECMDMYKLQKMEFLIDPNDSSKVYEERGLKRASENNIYDQAANAFANLGHTQQIDIITGYNNLKDKLIEYLQTFATNNQIVTQDDINRFFEGMRKEDKAKPANQYFCR